MPRKVLDFRQVKRDGTQRSGSDMEKTSKRRRKGKRISVFVDVCFFGSDASNSRRTEGERIYLRIIYLHIYLHIRKCKAGVK